ncbi:MAG: hypothetical protein ACFFCQ_16260, partial [Promethearchaeota archaeon]
MREKKITITILVILVLSMASLGIKVTRSAKTTIPEYEPVDWQSGLAGKLDMPEVTDSVGAYGSINEAYGDIVTSGSTPPVGSWAWDWYLAASSGYPMMQLRAVSEYAEVWVASDPALMFPAGDPRNADPTNWQVTDEMAEYIAEEFDSTIYSTCVENFGPPLDRDGTNTIFEQIGWPAERWEWIETDQKAGKK